MAWVTPKQRRKHTDVTKVNIQAEANELASQFATGNLNVVALHFKFPLVVYVGRRLMVLKDEDQFVCALSLYRSILSEEWLSNVTSSVLESRCASDSRCKVSVENRYFSTDGRDLGTARINYYGEATAAGRKIRMVEYLEWPCQKQVAKCLGLQCMMA
ncbi:MAG: hypothetical protein AAGA74_19180 [Pseudomonadota bacterium]